MNLLLTFAAYMKKETCFHQDRLLTFLNKKIRSKIIVKHELTNTTWDKLCVSLLLLPQLVVLRGQVYWLNYFTFKIGGFHMMSSPPCWYTEQKRKRSFRNLTLLLCKTWAKFAIVLCTNMAILSHDWKLSIERYDEQLPIIRNNHSSSGYHIWSRERAKYETVIHCSVPVWPV